MADMSEYVPLTVQERYTSTPIRAEFEREVEQSLQPRGPEMLFDLVRALGVGPDAAILDVGCGTGWAASPCSTPRFWRFQQKRVVSTWCGAGTC